MEVREVAEECRRTLVSLSGESLPDQSLEAGVFPGHRRRLPVALKTTDPAERLHRRLLSFASRVVAARRRHHVAAGLRLQGLTTQLGSAWLYMSSSKGSTTYVPVIGALVAEPPLGSAEVETMQVLPEHVSSVYADPARLFRPGAAAILAKQNRCFSRFMGDKAEYVAYMARPEVRSLWRLEPASVAQGRCSFACVPKREGKELRKILQVCPLNDAMWEVSEALGFDPQYGLQGCGALAQVVAPQDVVRCATLDQSNAFTFMTVPSWWQSYQAGPSLQAGELPLDWLEASGLAELPRSTMIAPQYTRLAMGHTHSVFLLMTVNRGCIAKACEHFPDWHIVLLNDEDTLNIGAKLGPRMVAIYLHVDDFGILSSVSWACEFVAQRIKLELEHIGFSVKSKQCAEVDRYVGLELQ